MGEEGGGGGGGVLKLLLQPTLAFMCTVDLFTCNSVTAMHIPRIDACMHVKLPV